MVTLNVDLDRYSEEVQQIVKLIHGGEHFLLSGGAGSGKTYSLVEVLDVLISDSPALNIACITYTNSAVDEIEGRISHDNLYVSTIHEFLWSNIKGFQTELKKTLIELINDPVQKKIKHPNGDVVSYDYFDGIEFIKYKEYLKIAKGIISHDELIILAARMFEKYEKLCSVTKDRYPFIFVDEYQDTDPFVIKILLEYLDKSKKNNVVGFFGDSMQSIYDGSIGNLDGYIKIESPKVIEVIKQQNRRNPLEVINLANKIRTDDLFQRPSEDKDAPNMDGNGDVKRGEIKFIYSKDNNLDLVRCYLGWDFDNSELVKELNLTHNLIADKAKFPELMRIYNQDKILDYIRNKVRKLLEDKDAKYDSEGKTLADVVEYLCNPAPTKGQKEYIERYPMQFQLAMDQPYEKIFRLYVDKDQLLDDKKNYVGSDNKPNSNRDYLIAHLFKIEECVRLYKSKNYNKFIKLTDYSIKNVKDKIKLNDVMQSFQSQKNLTVGEVIDQASSLGIVVKDDKFFEFSRDKYYLFKQVCDVSYQEFRNVFDYLEGYSTFSTQHKTKGAEFSDVLVILDNGRWNNYNFNYLFEGGGSDSVRLRTEKLFYVCCTRAKERLSVFFPMPSEASILKAREWFGEGNVINLDDLETTIFKSVNDPLRLRPLFEERWRGSDKGLITSWEVGRKKSLENIILAEKAKSGELPTLYWKGASKEVNSYGTLNYLAQWLGLRNEDLNIDLLKEVSLVCTKKGTTVTYTADQKKYNNN
jgi:DNA helicase-2/ATP-dependent DNA helicase PcrA